MSDAPIDAPELKARADLAQPPETPLPAVKAETNPWAWLLALKRHAKWVAGSIFLVTFLWLLIGVLSPPGSTLLAASIRSEILTYSPASPNGEASLPLKVIRGRLIAPGPPVEGADQGGECLEDTTLILASTDSKSPSLLRFVRTPEAGGELELSLSGQGFGESLDGTVRELASGSRIVLDPKDVACPSPQFLRFELYGSVMLDSQSAARTRAGAIEVFGRGGSNGSIYPVESLALPAGTQITCAAGRNQGQNATATSDDCTKAIKAAGLPGNPKEAMWTGYVELDFSDGELGFLAEIATNAEYMLLKSLAPTTSRAASGAGASAMPDVVSVSSAARLLGDPDWRIKWSVFLLLAGFIGVYASIAQISQWLQNLEKRQ